MGEVQAFCGAQFTTVLLQMVLDRSGNGCLLGGRVAVLAIRVVPELDISDLAGEGATASLVREVFDDVGHVENIAFELVLDSDARCSDNVLNNGQLVQTLLCCFPMVAFLWLPSYGCLVLPIATYGCIVLPIATFSCLVLPTTAYWQRPHSLYIMTLSLLLGR
jgi:hypothetical protein